MRMVPTGSRRNFFFGTVDEEDGTTCKDNMAKIKDKQRNSELNIGFESLVWTMIGRPFFILLCKIFPVDVFLILYSFCFIAD